MCDVQQLLCDLGQTFNKFKELRRIELLKVLGQRCSSAGYTWRADSIMPKRTAAAAVPQPYSIPTPTAMSMFSIRSFPVN
ncbi:uncharacterized protein [Drosophila virilis]|uniref:uncharacterized protein isoform X2 n=1 Tax=Drosophila virilis TaxID=7244 RepID=UPI0038B3D1DA